MMIFNLIERKSTWHHRGTSALTIFLIIIITFYVFFPSIARAQDKTETQEETIYVTGNPATSVHIMNVILDYFRKKGQEASICAPDSIPTLQPGQKKKIAVDLLNPTAEKERKTINICVENENVPIIPCEFLAFSNHPERIKERGILFTAALIRHKPVRFRYYHLGDENSPPHFLGLYLVNRTGKPARVHVVESVGGPSKDWIGAGHFNNKYFFSAKEKNLGRIDEIPPNSVFLVRRVKLMPGEVVSSTADLHLLSGEPLQIYTYASDKEDQDLAVDMSSTEGDKHARGAYPLTFIRTEGVFSLDKREAIYTIADTPMASFIEGKPNKGNYGVMYQYEFILKNPYPKERTVSFFFQPRGGVATATFSFNNKPVGVGFTRAYKMVRLQRINIPPNGVKKVIVETMPEDASNYPVRLILQSDL